MLENEWTLFDFSLLRPKCTNTITDFQMNVTHNLYILNLTITLLT